jgi:hypothetical protein
VFFGEIWVLFLALVLAVVLFHHLVIHLVELGVVFQTVGITESVQTVVGRGTARGDAGNHDDLGILAFGLEGIAQDQGEFGCSEGNVICLIVHCSDALLQC